MSKYDEMKGRLESGIREIINFLQLESGNEILIAEYEKDSTAYILSNTNKVSRTCILGGNSDTLDETKVFSIINSTQIGFVPIDGKKGLLGGDSNCDFIFFNESHFCFVELKLNAISLEERAIRKNRKKAIEQLSNTIDYFDSKLKKDYSSLELEAYVSTPDVYPRENTAWQSIKVEFLEKTGIDLFESREKRY